MSATAKVLYASLDTGSHLTHGLYPGGGPYARPHVFLSRRFRLDDSAGFFIIIILCFLLSACQAPPTATTTPSAAPELTATRSPQPDARPTLVPSPSPSQAPSPTHTRLPLPSTPTRQASLPPPSPTPSQTIPAGPGPGITRLTAWGEGQVFSAQFSPDGQRLLLVRSAFVDLLDASSGALLLRLPGLSASILWADFSPDGRYLAVNEAVSCQQAWNCRYQTRLFRVSDGAWLAQAPAAGWIGFSTTGELISYGQAPHEPGCALHAWDEALGDRLLREFRTAPDCRVLLSPDGRFMAVFLPEKRVRVLSLPGLAILGDFPTTASTRLATSPDGRWLATYNELQLNVWRSANGSRVFETAVSGLETLEINAQGSHVLGFDGEQVHLWRLETGDPVLEAPAQGAAFSRDGLSLLVQTGRAESQLYHFDPASESYQPGLLLEGSYPQFAPAGGLLAVQSIQDAGQLGVHSLDGSRQAGWEAVSLADHPSSAGAYRPRLLSLRFSPDGASLLSLAESAPEDGRRCARLWQAETGALRWEQCSQPEARPRALSFSPDGLQLAVGANGQVRLYGLAGQPGPSFPGDSALAFSPDGALLATGSGLWQLAGPQQLLAQTWNAAAFSPDGQRLAVGAGADIALYAPAWTSASVLPAAHRQSLAWLGFSPDGGSLASLGRDGVLRLWELANGESRWWRRTTYNPTFGYANNAAFSPDGAWLALGRLRYPRPGALALWDQQGQVLRELGQGYAFRPAFSPDGRLLLVGSASAAGSLLEMYDTQDWQVVWSARTRTTSAPLAAFAPDGRAFATALSDGTVLIWQIPGSVP